MVVKWLRGRIVSAVKSANAAAPRIFPHFSPSSEGDLFLIGFYSCYNEAMNENYNTPNSGCCGRNFPTAQPGCKTTCGPCSEYCGYAIGHIKKDVDPCKSCAVIPSITLDNVDGITNLANCLVHVASNNTTYYIDDKHRPMITWAGAVEVDAYDIEANPLNLRAQDCYTTVGGVYKLVRFDKQGVGHIMATEEE